MSAIRRILVGSDPRRTAVRIGVLAVISFVTFRWVLIPIRAEGVSMLPTYQSGTLHFVNRLSYSSSARPARRDIVAIRLGGEHVLYVKRVIGLPGERVRVTGGQIFIDGVPLDEPYVRGKARDLAETLLDRDVYFVIGDNRSQSDFGRVEASRIAGKVIF